jgi:hypothetical protein
MYQSTIEHGNVNYIIIFSTQKVTHRSTSQRSGDSAVHMTMMMQRDVHHVM